jgi:mannose-6-phosphate isomerase-like protein (cupin superfamily)
MKRFIFLSGIAALAIAAMPVAMSAQQPSRAPSARPATPSQPSTAPAATDATLPAGDVTAKEVNAFIDALPKDAISDRPIKGFDAGSHRVTVYGVFRPRTLPGDAILHQTRTSETYYILEGTGTLVTGGVLADMIQPAPGATNSGPRAKRIDGGVTRKVGPGDIIVIPGRTPHWWSSLDGDLRYIIIRSAPAPTTTTPSAR